MFRKLIQTDDDISRFVLRLLLGIVMFPHAAQKVLGWYGGPGFQGTMTAFTQNMGIPAVFALLAILAESLDRNLVVSDAKRANGVTSAFRAFRHTALIGVGVYDRDLRPRNNRARRIGDDPGDHTHILLSQGDAAKDKEQEADKSQRFHRPPPPAVAKLMPSLMPPG